MAPFLLLEGGTLAAYGWGWLDGWNILDFSTYAVQVRQAGAGWVGTAGDVGGRCGLALSEVQFSPAYPGLQGSPQLAPIHPCVASHSPSLHPLDCRPPTASIPSR